MSELLNLIDLNFDYVTERLSNFTVNESGCWEYQGQRSYDNYGRFRLGGRDFRAHRVAYAFYNGEDPRGMFVCHSCDNPPCFCPDHLFLGTPADNSRDMAVKGRAEPQPGKVNHAVKLTEPLVLDVVAQIKAGLSNKVIAESLPVTHAQVSLIRLGKSWGHLLARIDYNPEAYRKFTRTPV